MAVEIHPQLPERRTPKTRPGADRRSIATPTGSVELRRAEDGFWQVWPRPTPESQRELYAEQFYEHDKADYLAGMERERAYWDAFWSMRRDALESALPENRRRILDVGCSGGFFLDHFAQAGWTTFGIEPSPHASRYARERFGLEVFCGDLLEWMPADGHEGFDAIHSAQVLEHVLEPEACVARIAELLRPGGLVFIEVPNDFSALQETARETLGHPAWWVAPDHHLNYFDFASLTSLLSRHGLREIDRMSSFPMESFLLMGDDYVGQPSTGKACHGRRMRFERALIESKRQDVLEDLYRALARAGLGRTCGILARKDAA